MNWTVDWIGKRVKVGLFNTIMIEGILQECDDDYKYWKIRGDDGTTIFVHDPAIIIVQLPKEEETNATAKKD